MDLFSILFFVVGVPLTILTAVYAHATFLYARGDIAQQEGKLELAEKRFTKAARGLNPIGRGATLTALARVQLRMNRPDDAIQTLRRAAPKTKNPGIVLALYQLLIDAALHPEVSTPAADLLHDVERLLESTRMPATLRAMLLGQFAHAWARLENTDEARRLVETALAKDGLNPGALFTKGWLSLRDGDLDVARESFDKLSVVREKDQRPLGLYGLGTAAFYAGNLEEADRLYARALAEGSPLLEPFAAARAALVHQVLGKDAAGMLRRAEEAAEKLRSRKSLATHSSVDWLLAIARAWVHQDAAKAREALDAAPVTERAEAAALASALLPKVDTQGWKLSLPARP